MKFNVKKLHIIHHRPRSLKISQYEFKLGSNYIETVHSCKYLGIIIDEHLDFIECTNVLAQSGTRELGALIYKHRQIGLTYQTFTKLFDACVSPVIMYSIAIWGTKEFSKISTVQYKGMKAFLCVNRFTSNACIIGDMGWTDLNVIRKIRLLKFWNRLIKIEESRVIKQVFLYDYDKCKRNWCSEIKKIAIEIKQLNVFTNKILFNIEYAQYILNENFVTTWKKSIDDNLKMTLYNHVKFNYCVDNYVLYINNKRNR